MSHISAQQRLCTRASLEEEFRNLGVHEGDTILLHSSLSAIGWVNGGAESVIYALLDVLGGSGTLVVPTHTGNNSDPIGWRCPPVPEEWWQTIRDTMPAYHPKISQTRAMGQIPELLRTWPGALRSAHPQTSFAAVGAKAEAITRGHALSCRLGEESPIIELERSGARGLLLGVGFDSNTVFHLAEYRTAASTESNSFAVLVNGEREWVTVEDTTLDSTDFRNLGQDFEREGSVIRGRVGDAECRLFSISEAVTFATRWMNTYR
ncbi:hypothetical protein BGZ63DRAFT_357840 [Mariannaea sp. PMI_226]|nr:hypothetical protein BGZ63DRAFT_357840 [Mariannaea sp. PMI_226]